MTNHCCSTAYAQRGGFPQEIGGICGMVHFLAGQPVTGTTRVWQTRGFVREGLLGII